MTCTKYLGIITAPLLPALNSGIFIGNFLSKAILILKKHWRNKIPAPWTAGQYALWG